MTKIEPFVSDVLTPSSASRVVGLGYDALSDDERVHHARSNPLSFLGVLAPGEGGIEASERRLRELIDGGHFRPDGPALYLYRLTANGHEQTAVIADVHVDEFLDSRIRVHESTRTEKENELLDFTMQLRINSSPVCLAYPARDAIDECVAEQAGFEPTLDFFTVDDVRHQIWTIDDAEVIERLTAGFGLVDAAYVTDGHHRAAIAVRLADLIGGEDARRVLVALFPHDQLRILPFHRIIRDPAPRSDVIERLKQAFEVEPFNPTVGDDAEPAEPGCFALWIDAAWFRLRLREYDVSQSPVDALDTVIAQRLILATAFGLDDPRSDPRLDFTPGGTGLLALAAHAGTDASALAIPAVAIEQIVAVADAGLTLPPKSTWFDPKVRSGIWIRHR